MKNLVTCDYIRLEKEAKSIGSFTPPLTRAERRKLQRKNKKLYGNNPENS